MDPGGAQRKLKILGIHGYRQNGQLFRERTGAFRKLIKNIADVEFVTAPNVVPSNGEDTDANTDQRGWWFSHEDDFYDPLEETDCCKGFDNSLEIIKQTLKEKGPYDGILSFSQGASLTSLLCGLHERDPEGWPFQFAILVAGFKSQSKPHENLYQTPIAMPSLHIFGDTDKVIPKEMSEDLVPYFVSPEILPHPGGHFVPAIPSHKPAILKFLTETRNKKQGRQAV